MDRRKGPSLDQRASRLLKLVGALEHPCDLDLLVFFARHAPMLLTDEQLSRFVGYQIDWVAESLARLTGAGLVSITSAPGLTARMFVFEHEGRDPEALKALLALGSTREGRVALRRILTAGGTREQSEEI
jgi:hypothetical protein